MGAALLFLRTPAGRYILLGVAVLAVLGGLYGLGEHKGASKVKAADAKVQLAAKADVATHEATAAAISVEAQSSLQKVQRTTAVRFKTLVQRVPQVDTAEVDADCRVPKGWVDLYNSAVTP